MSKLSKELIRQIIADGEFSTPNDIGEYLKDMFKDVIQEMLEKDYIDLNISPGGCADLLAISILLINIKKKFYNDLNKKNITEN